ncbi:hypothetical protein NKI56_35000 [Mesorhizobium sp. M0622]|uniref:hypothetical protein n=1 Tax=Mesorhizobium sp. M0622 TaxID=2956975 RepID=UPI003338FD60
MAGGELDADQAMATLARIDVSDLSEVDRPVSDCPDPAGRIVVAFPSGTRLRIDGIVDPTAGFTKFGTQISVSRGQGFQ